MRITGTSLKLGKASLLTVTIWNNNINTNKVLPVGTYRYISANGITFTLVVQEAITVPFDSFVKRDFYSSYNDAPFIGSYPVSDNTSITVVNVAGTAIDSDITFDCADNAAQLGYADETLFEARQRILTDNARQEVLHILEERIQELANIHECTIIGNFTLAPVASPYLEDDGITYEPILPQSVLVIMTGSPTADFAQQFLTLCPFITTVPVGVAAYGTVYYETDIYTGGRFPVHYVPHRIKYFDIIIQYGYSSHQTDTAVVEGELTLLLQAFKASTKFKQIITSEDIDDTLSAYQNPSIKILSITFNYNNAVVNYMQFNKTQIARLQNITFQKVALWAQ